MTATAFVQDVIKAAGGLEKWEKVSSIAVKFDFTGATLGIKGRPGHLIVNAVISTKEQKVVYTGLGGNNPNEQWIFTPAKVWKQRISDGAVLDERQNPREAFKGHVLETPWDDFHFVYFAGYALWQYFNFPYFLARPEFQTTEGGSHQENGQKWRVLQVHFPDQSVFASHGSVQRYYFDDKFVLQRHDYAPDVLAGSSAAHYTYDDVNVDGLSFATLRRVLAAVPVEGGGASSPLYHGPIPTLIHLVFYRIELQDEAGKQQGVWTIEG